MGASITKCSVLVLNGQGGKTRRIQDMIKEEEAICPGNLNFVIQANNRSLVEQTAVRMSDDLFENDRSESDAKIEGACFSWYSGNGPKITVDDLVGKILSGSVTMVVCCANRKRLTYLCEVIGKVEATLKRFRSSIKMNIWIDEADATMHYWRDYDFQSVMKKDIVEKVTMVTATVDAIVKEFKSIRVIPIENPTLPIYFRVQDYAVECLPDQKMSADAFLKMAVEANYERYMTPGTRTFAPGAVERKSHEAIASYALSVGGAVVILNGLRKEIRIPCGDAAPEIIVLPKMSESVVAEELGKVIGRLYEEKDLKRFALFVTGNICLGRGITFQNEKFLFDHQIIPSAFDTRAAAYQAACRGAGNIKKLPNFVAREKTGFQPTIMTTETTWRCIVEAETIASTLAKKAFHSGCVVVTEQDLTICSGNSGGLEFSNVPVCFALPESLVNLAQQTHNIATWRQKVLDAIKALSPSLYDDLVANYPEGHVDNYSLSSLLRYKGMFRPIYEASKKKERARVPKFENARGNNIWYAALDHTYNHLVICRWEGKKMV
jgi:hypothetical protein